MAIAVESKDQSTEGSPPIQTGNVGEGVFKDRAEKARYISEETFKRLRCSEIFEGDCLISTIARPGGTKCHSSRYWRTDDYCGRLHHRSLRSGSSACPHFFNYYSQSSDYLNTIAKERSGHNPESNQPEQSCAYPDSVPPLPEQHRIVAILDEAFDGIATAKANAEKNLQNARALFESHLQSVFTERGEGWADNKLKAITTKIGSGATPRGGEESYKTEGISLIRSLNVHDLAFKYGKLAFLDDTQADDLSNVEVKARDVLLNITGASVARCCIVPDDVLPARVNQHVSIIRPLTDVLAPEFLHYLLISKPYKEKLLQTGEEGGSTRQAITKAQIQDFSVAYPVSVDDQLVIVGKLDAMLAETQRLESLYQQKLTALDDLKKSLLHQAFSGNL